MSETNEEVIAILCADIHLQAQPPIWRSAEPDWYEAMQRPLDEIKALQKQTGRNCPVLCAGDIFDKWYGAVGKQSSELINWALKHLPDHMYCIPGQHDLPDHNYEQIWRSAYSTLVRAGKIKDIQFGLEEIVELGGGRYGQGLLDNGEVCTDDIRVYGFPYGLPLRPLENRNKRHFHIALAHEYIWMTGHSYPGAPKEGHLKTKVSKIKNQMWNGYDVVVYGDNHKGFLGYLATTAIFNCGTLMRRASDEIDYKPRVGLLYEDGTIKPHYLDTSKDKYIEKVEDAPLEEMDMSEFIEELKKLGETGLEFTKRVERFFKKNKTRKVVRNIIRKGMEE